jgi:hypothetical protein
LDRHDSGVPNLRLKTPIFLWRCPGNVNLRRAAGLDDCSKARHPNVEQLHLQTLRFAKHAGKLSFAIFSYDLKKSRRFDYSLRKHSTS